MAVPYRRLRARRPQRPPRRQRGVALILAMVIVAMIAVLTAETADRQLLDIRRTSNILSYDQAYAYATGMESWAAVILMRDKRDSPEVDSLGEAWAQPTPVLPVEGGQLAGRLEDLQGRFNLNNLYNPPQGQAERGSINAQQLAVFQRLLASLGLSPGLADAVVDWIDLDQQSLPQGAEDPIYARLQPGYRTADWQMASITELRLVQGFDAETYNALSPYVCALPRGSGVTKINVNTASAPVLAALHDDLTEIDGEALIEDRGPEGFADLAEFNASPTLTSREIVVPNELIDVKSDYFLGRADVELGDARLVLYSVLARGQKGVQTLARTTGDW